MHALFRIRKHLLSKHSALDLLRICLDHLSLFAALFLSLFIPTCVQELRQHFLVVYNSIPSFVSHLVPQRRLRRSLGIDVWKHRLWRLSLDFQVLLVGELGNPGSWLDALDFKLKFLFTFLDHGFCEKLGVGSPGLSGHLGKLKVFHC